jgi:hypothetical protein
MKWCGRLDFAHQPLPSMKIDIEWEEQEKYWLPSLENGSEWVCWDVKERR